MSFRVLYEGADLWVPGTKDVIDPVVEIELNTAGRVTMTMLPNHPDYFNVKPLRGTVEVYEGSEMVWFGRPVYLERTMDGHKSMYCEGALAYLNDSVQAPRPAADTTAAALFASILSAHNAQVPANRQFTAGTVSVPATTFSWENDYEETLHCVQTLLTKAGGYLLPRRSGGTNYLDYIYDLPLNSGQPVRYGLNMTDFDRKYDFGEKFTAVYPIGGVPEGESDPVTIASVNQGSNILDGDKVSTYGRIVKMLKFPEIVTAAELLAVAQRYLAEVNFSPITIRASAVDLSLLSPAYTPYRVGNQYHVTSQAHDVDAWLPLTKMKIAMDQPVREISLGTKSNPGVTELAREQERQTDYIKQSIAPAVGGRDWYTRAQVSVNGYGYTVVFMNGDTVLETVKNVAPGASVTYSGATPVRAGHTFTGWDKTTTNVQEDLVVYAQFTANYTWTADPGWIASQKNAYLCNITTIINNRDYRKKYAGKALAMVAYGTFSDGSNPGVWVQPLLVSDDPNAVTVSCVDTLYPSTTKDNLTYNKTFQWEGITWYVMYRWGFRPSENEFVIPSTNFPVVGDSNPISVPDGMASIMAAAGVTVTWAE